MKLTIAFTVATILSAVATADPAPVANPTPTPCSSPDYHAFDFWVGTWEVYSPDGTLAGENVISRQENGCLLLENWTDTGGNTGQSYNYYDPNTEKWRQLWISTGSIIDYSGGLTDSGSMKLEGEITYQATGLNAAFTGEWTPNEDGTVTQHFEQYDPEADTWNVWFTGTYERKDTPQASK